MGLGRGVAVTANEGFFFQISLRLTRREEGSAPPPAQPPPALPAAASGRCGAEEAMPGEPSAVPPPTFPPGGRASEQTAPDQVCEGRGRGGGRARDAAGAPSSRDAPAPALRAALPLGLAAPGARRGLGAWSGAGPHPLLLPGEGGRNPPRRRGRFTGEGAGGSDRPGEAAWGAGPAAEAWAGTLCSCPCPYCWGKRGANPNGAERGLSAARLAKPSAFEPRRTVRDSRVAGERFEGGF